MLLDVGLSDLQQLAQSLGAGAAFLLIVALIGVQRGWWVPGYIYKAKERDCEKWETIAMRSIRTVGDAVDVARK